MKNYLIAGVTLLLLSCGQKSTNTQQKMASDEQAAPTTSPGTSTRNIALSDRAELDKYLKQFERPTQHFIVGADSNSEVKGAGGTRIFIVPGDLEFADGSPLMNKITLSLIELQNQEDLLRNGMPTTSNGRLLESGGSYYIGLACGGKQLRLKKGRSLAVEFPKKSTKTMQLFYGVKDREGGINWDYGKETLRPKTSPDSIVVRVPILKYKDTILAEMEVRPDHKPKDIDADKFRRYGQTAIKFIDGHYYYVGQVPDASNQQYRLRKVSASAKSISDVYEVMRVNSLGWINCDRYPASEMIALQVVVPVNNIHSNIETFIVLRDINGVVRQYIDCSKNQQVVFDRIPANMRAKVLAFAWKNGVAYGYAQALNTSPGAKINLDLKPVTKAEIAQMMVM